MLLGIASVVSYVNDLDILVAALQIVSLMVFKKMTYDRATANFSDPSQARDARR